jgi:hypothetical protein
MVKIVILVGYNGQANHKGAFLWSDGTSTGPFTSSVENSFNISATGGIS